MLCAFTETCIPVSTEYCIAGVHVHGSGVSRVNPGDVGTKWCVHA